MIEVIGVRFKKSGKTYYFAPQKYTFKKGQHAIVETARGLEFGEVVLENRQVAEESVVLPLKQVVRPASKSDVTRYEENLKKAASASDTFNARVAAHKLDMHLTDVEFTFDNNKILFYFTADGRVDFRDLVKDLASVFKTRIELRQIGVRDEARMQGGIAICGQPFCCATFLREFQPVSIKMAKEQGLSLNPTKISGSCGRLMCCLKYEQEAYEELLKITPKLGAIVSTAEGKGVVVDLHILKGTLKIKLDENPDAVPVIYHRNDIKLIKDGSVRLSKKELAELAELEKE